MAISFTRYVDITSGVSGQGVVTERALIGRIFTGNTLLPPGTFITFENADDVATYFGSSSAEYARALFYFGWISKSISQPQQLTFARWAVIATPPIIWGNKLAKLLATFTAITAGALTLTLGAVTHTFTGLDFSGDASLAAVAATLQTAINAYSAGSTMFTAATVAYDATTNRFNLTGGVAGAAAVVVVDGAQTPAAAFGWISGPGLILAPGASIQAIADALGGSANTSDNFGSFWFIPTLTEQNIIDAATWNAGQNVKFIFTVAVTPTNAAAWSADVIALAGTGLTLAPLDTEYPEQAPGMILAATPYDTGRNVTQNYMFQQFALTASVSTDADADTYDALRINYYGNTQSAGQQIDFYQRGILCGNASTDAVDMNVYANEIWLKSRAGAAFMNLMLALPEISASNRGRISATNALLGVIGTTTTPGTALYNGVISVGKPLSSAQQAAVTTFTGDPNAWRQVQSSGYWYDLEIAPYTNDVTNLTEWEIVYTLVYSKDDAIRKVVGRHVLV